MSRRAARRRLTLLATATLALLATVAIAAEAASADTQTVGLGGWQVQSSAQATQSAQQISTPGFADGLVAARQARRRRRGRHRGRRARADRPLPERVLLDQHEDLLRLHERGRRGHDPAVLRAVVVPHRLRRAGELRLARDLIVNGVVGQADVWVNGHEVATARPCRATTRATRSTSPACSARGTNTLALEVYPNDPNTMFTLDNVDWTQIPPDNNTGIQFPIQLHTSGPLALSNAHVVQDDAAGPLERRADREGRRDQPRRRRRRPAPCRPPSTPPTRHARSRCAGR